MYLLALTLHTWSLNLENGTRSGATLHNHENKSKKSATVCDGTIWGPYIPGKKPGSAFVKGSTALCPGPGDMEAVRIAASPSLHGRRSHCPPNAPYLEK